MTDENATPEIEQVAQTDDIGYRTLAQGFLSPRHRRLCQMAAEGRSNQEIAKELGYVDSRVSILLKHPAISAEISRLQERIFEETIGGRLKSFADPALNVLERALKDQTNRVKESDKIQIAQWVIEKLDGKAVQKTDIGENLLAVLMDKLDSRAAVPREVSPVIETQAKQLAEGHNQLPETENSNDSLADWVTEFDNASS